jgi:hypothetical protein
VIKVLEVAVKGFFSGEDVGGGPGHAPILLL